MQKLYDLSLLSHPLWHLSAPLRPSPFARFTLPQQFSNTKRHLHLSVRFSLLQWCESCSVVSNSLRPHGLHSPWNSPGQTAGVRSLSLLQWIFLTQELNRGLLHCRKILYQPSYHSYSHVCTKEGLHWWLSDEVSSCNAEDAGDVGSIWRDPLEKGMATHSSILTWRTPMDRGAWRAAVHGVAKNQTQLSN